MHEATKERAQGHPRPLSRDPFEQPHGSLSVALPKKKLKSWMLFSSFSFARLLTSSFEINNWRPLDSRTRTTFDFKFFFAAYSKKIDTPESYISLFFTTKVSTDIFIEGG